MTLLFYTKILQPANLSNDRGRRTWEWKISDGRQITVYSRRAGEVFGMHFHKGEDPSKNPERFLLLSGRVRVRFSSGKKKSVKILDANLNPVELIIYPNVLHEFTAETDCLYIEYRLTHFDPNSPDTYLKLKKGAHE